jgi:molybdopterin/thiamine biosynthesis adenylyltransferase
MIASDRAQQYSRIQAVGFIGKQGLATLQRKQVAVFGVGNIGHQTAYHLALLGVRLVLVDRGLVGMEHIATQGYAVAEIGTPKVYALAKRLTAINADGAIVPLHSDLRSLGMAALQDSDLYLCCLDSLADRLRLNETAYRMGIPWIDAALDGTGQWLYAKTAIYDPRVEQSPCYLCQWDSESLQAAPRVERERADTSRQTARGCPNWRLAIDHGEFSAPTLSISSFGGVIAGIQCIVALDLLLGADHGTRAGTPATAGTEIALNLSNPPFTLRESRLERHRPCLFDHRVYRRLSALDGVSDELTLARTFEEAERLLGPGVVPQLHGRELIAKLRCPDCRGTKAIYTLADAIREADTLCACGGRMRAAAHGRWSEFNGQQAAPFLRRTWAELGLPRKDVVTATDGTRAVHFIIGV